MAALFLGSCFAAHTRYRDSENCNDSTTPAVVLSMRGGPPLAAVRRAVPAPTPYPGAGGRSFPVDWTFFCHTAALGLVRLSPGG